MPRRTTRCLADQRLNEARLLWGRAVFLCREIAQTAATVLLFNEALPRAAEARQAAADTCRYLAAWCWELNAKLTGPQSIRSTKVYSDNVLTLLLQPREAAWMAEQRSRPLILLGALRRTMHAQFEAGNLPPHLHRKLEEDMRELDLVVGGCERLFSSPVPPTMSRHVVRSLVLWLATLPFVLAGTMTPRSIALWVGLVGYIFVGIEEVGVQVEQPFEIVPMTQLCNIIMANLEEAIAAPPDFVDAVDGEA